MNVAEWQYLSKNTITGEVNRLDGFVTLQVFSGRTDGRRSNHYTSCSLHPSPQRLSHSLCNSSNLYIHNVNSWVKSFLILQLYDLFHKEIDIVQIEICQISKYGTQGINVLFCM